MCRHSVSVLNGIAFAVLIASALACAICYVAPFWLYYPGLYNAPSTFILIPNSSKEYPFAKASYRGVWAACFRDKSCLWFWEDSFAPEKSLPEWYIAVQCVFGAGLLLFIVAILIQSIYSCCRCCGKSTPCPTVVASFAVSAGLLIAVALAVFGGFSHKDGAFDMDAINDSRGAQLEWSFYLGIAGSGAAVFAALLFYADGCRTVKRYGGYNTPPTIKTT